MLTILKGKPANTLVISDTHFPYHHKNTFDFLEETASRWKCSNIVSVGDMFDLHRTGRHLPEPDSMSIKDEISKARIAVKTLSSIFPKVRICYGNHDLRAFKSAKEKGISPEMLRTIGELYHCPDTWEFNYEYIIDGVKIFHGDGYSGLKGAMDAATKNRMSVAIGHLHSFGGVNYHHNGYNRIFGMNVGCLIDVKAPAFAYAQTSKDKPTIGCGVIVEGKEAYFIPL